jgi:hypothetical protein
MMTRRSPPRVAHTGVTLRMHGFHLKLDLPDEKGGLAREILIPLLFPPRFVVGYIKTMRRKLGRHMMIVMPYVIRVTA